MNSDSWRMHYTYIFGFVLSIAALGLVFLKLDEIPPEALLALVTFILGLVLGFFFNRESGAGQARATERAVNQGANAGAIPPPVESAKP